MSMARSKVARDILAGLEDALAYARGDETRGRVAQPSQNALPDIDVARIRKETGLSQAEFALAFRISIGTLKGWEQGRRRPDGPALVLLSAIRKDPKTMVRLIAPGEPGTRVRRGSR
jgi:putative transcriptional regulator